MTTPSTARRIVFAAVVAVSTSLVTATSAHAQADCEAVSGNLVQNCGFEAATDSWNAGGIGLGGGFFAHSGTTGLAGGSVYSLGHWTQDIATTAGQSYTVSFWYHSTGWFTNGLFASFGGQTLIDQLNLPANDWTQYSFDVTALGETSTLDLGLRNDPAYDGIDDVSVSASNRSVTATPEPASLALLGTGLLALGGVARRRRSRA